VRSTLRNERPQPAVTSAGPNRALRTFAPSIATLMSQQIVDDVA
jgi:hypothetical protein